MAIFAQRTTFRSQQIPDFKVSSPLNNGQVLIWDDKCRAFINAPQSALTGVPTGGGGGGGGSIVGGDNLGAGAQLFKDVDSNLLRFRTLDAGPGISIETDTYAVNEITIINNIIQDAKISVPDSFKLIIDNDNSTLNSAKFEICSFRPGSSVTLTPVTNSFPNFDITVVTDVTFTNPGKFISSTVNFATLGFEVGMCLEVIGTDEQDGIWEIASISTTTNLNDTITITIPFPDATDAGAQPPVTMNGVFFKVLTNQSLQSFGRDWTSDGFVAGQVIDIVGTTDNDGTYTIDSISSDIITIIEILPGTIGCDVGTISISTPVGIQPVGWWVDEQGNMKSQNSDICGDLDVTGNTSIDGDLTVGGELLEDIIINLLPIFPNNGLLVQTSTNTFDARAIIGANGITIVDGDGLAGNPTISADNFDITIDGDINGSATVTGLTDTTIIVTLPTITVANTYNRVTVNAKGQVVSGADIPLDFQPADLQLDNLADGMDNIGIVVWNGSDYIDRIIIGTVNEIDVINGDGFVNNPQIGLADNPIIPGAESVRVPRGFTAQRPSVPVEGLFRYNQTEDRFEGFHDSTWEQFAHLNDFTGVFLSLTGGSMFGDIDMNTNNIITNGLIDGRNISDDGIILDAINTGVGIKVQTGVGTFVNRTIQVEINEPLGITDGDGISGNPTISFNITSTQDLPGGDVIDQDNDEILIHDASTNSTRKVTISQLIQRDAFRYFFAQI